MAFDKIQQVPTPDALIKSVLAAGRAAKGKRKGELILKKRSKERDRVTRISHDFASRLKSLVRNFPSVDELTEFYRELLSTQVDVNDYKEKLARVQNSTKVVHGLAKTFRGKITATDNPDQVDKLIGAYIGRVSSVVKKLKSDLHWLEKTRLFLKTFPTVKDHFTVCIAGFPNVGKTTLLKKLTGSKAEINEYAFTTKSLNLGYRKFSYHKVQFIDTPGTLNRKNMNPIEVQANLALKYLGDVILYVFDPTEEYPLIKQHKLWKTMEAFDKPVLVMVSKQDIGDPKVVEKLVKKYDAISVDELLEYISKKL